MAATVGGATSARVFYVNDAATVADEWATQPGSDVNDGLSPATPKATIGDVLADYDLNPGDVVRIDTGRYQTSSSGIVVDATDGGSSGAPVTFELSPYGVTVDGRQTGSSWYTWQLLASYVTVTTVSSTSYPDVPQRWASITGAGTGIRTYNAQYITLDRLDLNGNSREGVSLGGTRGYSQLVANCLIRGNGETGVYIASADGVTVRNTTIMGYSTGVFATFSGGSRLVDNVIWADGPKSRAIVWGTATTLAQDYNDLYATNGAAVGNKNGSLGASLAQWQALTGQDSHSISVDPLFAETTAGDFHLKSNGGRYDPASAGWVSDRTNSPAVDAGDPTSAYGREPSPNGLRVNLGAYGNTEQASKSDLNAPSVAELSVSDTLLSDADSGNGKTFRVTINFSEAMDTAVSPSLGFNPSPGNSLSNPSGAWLDKDTFAVTFQVGDQNVQVDDVQIDVTGAKDAVGNQQADYTPEAEFDIDTLNPAAGVVAVAPDPRATGVDQIVTQFSEPVSGLDVPDFALTRDNGRNLLTASQALSTSDGGKTWTLKNVRGLTATPGAYRLLLTATGAGVRDAAGNPLEDDATESWTCIAGQMPTVSFRINDGAAFTKSRTVELAITASSSSSAVVEMRFAVNSLDEASYSGWEPFAATKTLTLPNWQGPNYVNVQARDAAGNVAFAWSSIILDTVGPTTDVHINQGASVTNSRTVNLALAASDATCGVTDMRFAINSLNEESYSHWEPFSSNKTLTLPNWQGPNYVNVQVRDAVGNVTLAWRSIILDTVAPTVSLQINQGAGVTNSRTVNLTLAASDATSGVTDMRFAINSLNEASYSVWEPFAAMKTVTLPNYAGRNYVNVQVRDRAGNIGFAWNSIVLNLLAPTIVQPATAAANPLRGTSTAISVRAADDGGEAILAYTWTVTAMPTNAPAPGFSVNGSNAAKNSIATFFQAGTYILTATVTDTGGHSATSSVAVVVSQSLTRITVAPANVSLRVGTAQRFVASGLDQFGKALASQPNFTWTASGGGSIGTNTGLFVVPLTPAKVTVIAASGSLAAKANVTVTLGLKDAALDILTATKFTNDGKIDRPEVMEILRSTGSDDSVVDAGELADLKTILNKATLLQVPGYVQVLAGDIVNGNPANARYQGQTLGNLAAGSPATQLNKLVDKWFLGADHPTTSYAYQSFAGSLFVNSPTYTDMGQGALGDCYFIAAMGAIAKSSIAAIQNMFIANGDNTWTVRFYVGGTADYVTVDRFLPTSGGYPIYQRVGGGNYTNSGNELWLALAEKAYAQWNETGKSGRSPAVNSYASIEGGYTYTASDQVLGSTSTVYVGLLAAHKQPLIAAIQANKAVTFSVASDGNGLVGGHAYVVVGYDSSKDTFQLYNPWGKTHPGPLTYAQLQANGRRFVVADTANTASAGAAVLARPAATAGTPIRSTSLRLAMDFTAASPSPTGIDCVLGAMTEHPVSWMDSEANSIRSRRSGDQLGAALSWLGTLYADRNPVSILQHVDPLDDLLADEFFQEAVTAGNSSFRFLL